MSLIDFSGGKAENNALRERQQAINNLQSQTNRFNYPGIAEPREFDNLLGFSWDGISFPVNNVTFDIIHTQIPHRFPHQDGALVESVGREPLQISANCLFFNTLVPAKSEDWKVGELYPTVYQQFMESMSVGTKVGSLVHPYFGSFTCKPLTARSMMDGSVRDGEMVNASWIVTLQRSGESAVSNSVADKLSSASATAATLDAALNPPPSILQLDTPSSFTDFMNEIQGIIDSVDRGVRSVKNTFNEPLNQVNKIIAATERVNDTSVETVKQAARYHKLALLLLEQQIQFLTFNRVGIFTATLILNQDSTFGEIKLDPRVNDNNSVEDLIRLNPELTKRPIIKQGTEIRYFRIPSPEQTLGNR